MALKTLGLSFRDTWQELWTVLTIHLLFLLGNALIVPGPPATLALFFYGNRIAHGEFADARDFLGAVRKYWGPAWRWAGINLLVIAILAGDYYLTERIGAGSNTAAFMQGLYIAALGGWLLVQLFTPPFLFEQEEPSVRKALRNAVVFIGRNLVFVLGLVLLLMLTLGAGMLLFLLSLVFGSTFVAFASNHAVIERISNH